MTESRLDVDSGPLWADLAGISREAVIRLTGPLSPQDEGAVAICIVAQATERLGFSASTQRMMANRLANVDLSAVVSLAGGLYRPGL